MTVAGKHVSISSSVVTQVVASAEGSMNAPTSVLVGNDPANSHFVWLGGSDVSSSNGFKLAVGQSVPIDLKAGEILYALADTSATTLSVLYTGVN